MFRVGIILLGLSLAVPGRCADSVATARGAFSQLPISIFENTPEGLTETDKQELLLGGKSEFWEIAGETEDMLVLAERPLGDKAVAVRVFRRDDDGSSLVAIGSLGEPICTLELWHMDTSGRILPMEPPAEPAYADFFRQPPPKSPGQSVMLCLGLGGLVASPLLWGRTGASSPKTDYEISFMWDGEKFVRQLQPIGP